MIVPNIESVKNSKIVDSFHDTEKASNISYIPNAENVFEPNNIEAPDTLDSLLSFLKTHGDSPVSGLLDLRGLLLEQKEEKVMLRTLVDEMRVDIASLRYALYQCIKCVSIQLIFAFYIEASLSFQ